MSAMLRRCLILALLARAGFALAAPDATAGSWKDAVLLHASMEGTADADRAAGDPKAQLSGPTSFVSGRRGQGLYLPKGAACSYAVEGNLNLAAGTLAAWVCLDRDTASWDAQKGSWYQWLFGLRDGNGDQRSDLRVFFAQSLALQYATPRPKPTEGSSYVGDLKWPGKQWHHVAVTFRAHEIKLFVDGKPVGTPITNCDTLAAATGRILLGCSDESGQGSLGGVVDEFFVLSRALTDAEAYALYLTTGGVGDTTGLRPVGLAGMKPSATPPAWTDAFAKAGLADGVSEYVAFGPSAQAPGPALAARPDALFRAAPSSDDRGRSYALWLRFPSKSTTATSVPALNLSFREPSVATAACEVNEVNGRATLIVADDQRIFGGSPSTYRLAPAEWHHLVLVFRPDGMAEEYLDGVLQYRAQAGMMPRGLSEISLAPDSGALQEAMSYARALSPSEVAALFNYGASGLGVPAKVSAEERPYWDLTAAYHGTAGGVDRLCLNGLWRFLPADGMGVAPPLGRAWGYARVPGSFCAVHHFTAYDPAMKPIPNELWTDGRPFTHYFPNSYDAGWYERTVDIPADWKGRRLSLLFDRIGAYAARICINGRLAAHFEQTLPGEACLFPQRRIDVSAYAGQTVRVSVEVGWDDAGACDLYTLGDVWLTAESGWVDVESASPITKVRPDKTLSVSAILHNSGTAPVEVSAAARVLDKTAQVLALPAKSVHLDPGATQEVTLRAPFPTAHLWSPDDPYLYTLAVDLKDAGGAVVKTASHRFGFREFWIDGRDFVLNGHVIHLRGSNANIPFNFPFSDPDYVRRFMRAHKSLGYNYMQYWTDATVGAMGGFTYALHNMLDLCDEMGFVAAVGNVSHLADVKDEAAHARIVDAFTREYGRHASVCLWFVNPNTCWYNFGMHPGNLDCVYRPSAGEPGFEGEAIAAAGEKVVRDSDPQGRPVFTYASGNFGPIYTAMQYMSLGLPLQEESDWPSLWSEKGPKPLYPVETDLKWTPHWVDFESCEVPWGDQSGVLTYYVEHSARYLGDAPYLQTANVPDGLETRSPEGRHWNDLSRDPYVLQVRALAAHDLLRGYRGYGISAVTLHAEEDDLFETWSYPATTNRPYTPAELQTPGPKPELNYRFFPRFMLTDRPQQPFADTFARNFAPLLVFIGGTTLEPGRVNGAFNSADHAFYAGETAAKQVVVVNDRTDRDLDGRFEWRLTDAAGKAVASGDGTVKAASGQIVRAPIAVKLPAVTVRTDISLGLRVFEGGQLVGEDTLALQVFPRPAAPADQKPVALLDTPDGKTAAALKAAGIPFRTVTSAADLAGATCLVVGQGVLGDGGNPILADLETSGVLDKGLNILVLSQHPCPLLDLIFEADYERYVWPRFADSRILAGLSAPDFANWSGFSRLIDAYAPPDPAGKSAPHYPGLKWHWGNRGIVSTYPVRKPAYGNFRVLADDGFDLVLSPLIEWLAGPSRIIVSQLDVVDRAGADPVATMLLQRLCAYASTAPSPTYRAAAWIGSAAGKAYLAPHRLALQDAPAELAGIDVLVSDGVGLDARRADVDALLARGGTLLMVNPSVAALKEMGLTASEEKVWHAKLPAGSWPLMDGVGPSELYWRTERAMPVLSALPPGSRATSPAVIAEIPRGQGRIVVWAANATAYDDNLARYESNRGGTRHPFYAKTSNQDKIHRGLSIVLTNLGVRSTIPPGAIFGGKHPAALARASWPYLDGLSTYDFNAFHNW